MEIRMIDKSHGGEAAEKTTGRDAQGGAL